MLKKVKMNQESILKQIEHLQGNYKKYNIFNDFFGKKAELNHKKIQNLINQLGYLERQKDEIQSKD